MRTMYNGNVFVAQYEFLYHATLTQLTVYMVLVVYLPLFFLLHCLFAFSNLVSQSAGKRGKVGEQECVQ